MEGWEIIVILIAIIKNEILFFAKKFYLKLKKYRYDPVLDCDIVNLSQNFKNYLNSEGNRGTLNLFHNGGGTFNGVPFVRYSTIYSDFNFFNDFLITRDTDLLVFFSDASENKEINGLFYNFVYDKNRNIIGFSVTEKKISKSFSFDKKNTLNLPNFFC